MMRQTDRKIKDFVLELQKHSAICNLGDQLETRLGERLVTGINITNSGGKLIQEQKGSSQSTKTACINNGTVDELDF